MNYRALVLVAALTAGSGCVPFARKGEPEMPKPRVYPNVQGSPSVRLVVNDHSDSPRKVARSLKRARKRFPFLSAGSEELPDPDYTIELAVWTDSEGVNAEFSGLTMLLVPYWINHEVRVQTRVSDADGRLLGVFQATGRRRTVFQMHLIFAAPIAVPMIPVVDRRTWNKTFRDALILAGGAIADDRRSPDDGTSIGQGG